MTNSRHDDYVGQFEEALRLPRLQLVDEGWSKEGLREIDAALLEARKIIIGTVAKVAARERGRRRDLDREGKRWRLLTEAEAYVKAHKTEGLGLGTFARTAAADPATLERYGIKPIFQEGLTTDVEATAKKVEQEVRRMRKRLQAMNKAMAEQRAEDVAAEWTTAVRAEIAMCDEQIALHTRERRRFRYALAKGPPH
jgi:hypothetical protein